MNDSNDDASVYRFPDVDLTIPRPERRSDLVELPRRSDSKDGIAMFGYLETELGPVGTRTIEVADRPAWPVRPLDLTCMEATAPRPDVLSRIREILPTFSPEENSLAWCSVVGLVRSVGWSAEEVRQMDYEELAFILDLHGQRWRLERCDRTSARELASAIAKELREKPRSPRRGLPVDQRLKLFYAAAEDFCIDADLEDIATILNCGVSSFYGGDFFETELQPKRTKAKKATQREVYDSEDVMNRRAIRDHDGEVKALDERIDAEG
jgi:hypothetical protein